MKKLGVIVLSKPSSGGTYQYTLSVLEALRHAVDYEVTLYGDPTNQDFLKFGFPVHKFAESRIQQLGYLAASAAGVRLQEPFPDTDLLIAPIYSLALLHTTKPFAYTLHDLQELHFPENFSLQQKIWRRSVHSLLSRKAGRIICESEFVKIDIVRAFGIDSARIAIIIAPPLRRDTDALTQNQIQDVRRRLDLPERFVFYPAQFWPHKNHRRLVEAFALIVACNPDVKLVLTGQKKYDYAAVMRKVADLKLERSVRHLGYIDQVGLQAIYRLATVVVMPSLYESVSIPIYEAFDAKTPVAASNILAIPSQVGDAGVLFNPLSGASIAAGLEKLLDDRDHAKALGEQGNARIRELTSENCSRQLTAMLASIERSSS